MTDPTLPLPPEALVRLGRLTLLTACLDLILGFAALGLGLATNAIALGGFGIACLLQVPLALSLRGRIRDGLGNRGLDRDRRILRALGHCLHFLALGLALASAAAWYGQRSPELTLAPLALATSALGLQALLWGFKRGPAPSHPALALDAARTRALLEMAALLLAGSLLGRWFPWADAASGLAVALRLFLEARAWTKTTALQAACGGCGSGCGCG